MIVPKSKYDIKCPYEMTPETITVHNTYNDASALREISYMITNNNYVSYHCAVDDIQVVQGIPWNRSAWHAGDGNGDGNRKSIAIEICYSKSGGQQFTDAEKNAVDLIVYLLDKFNLDISKVKKHQDWSNKYCPHRTLDEGWDRFINMVKTRKDGVSSITEGLAEPTNRPIYRVRKIGGNASTQIGAYVNLDNAKKACVPGYVIYDENGDIVMANSLSTPVKPALISNWSSDVIYQVYAGGRWYPPVTNLSDYAGDGRNPIKAVAIKVTQGSIEYRVHVRSAGRWYPIVTGYNIYDIANGYAGDCKNDIDAIEVYFKTPSGYTYKKAKYRVAPINKNYYSWQLDNETGNGMDGYAGAFGVPIGKFQMIIE